MGAAEQIPRISFEEFLHLEELNASKHGWLDGIVYMMAGGTFEHGRLSITCSSRCGSDCRTLY